MNAWGFLSILGSIVHVFCLVKTVALLMAPPGVQNKIFHFGTGQFE